MGIDVLQTLQDGVVIPAHPLALTSERKLDERRQRALTRYYLHSGAGGVAVGVHTTQFAIHDDKIGLYYPVLQLASETMREFEHLHSRKIIKVAGVIGKTEQALHEATSAVSLGYQIGLVSLSAFRTSSDDELIDHCKMIAEVISLFGFYLQPAAGGRILSYNFWRRFIEIENVVAIKIAPFNRYRTLDVLRAIAESNRTDVALYTGNDDNIVNDLVTSFRFGYRQLRIVGGLLGHWAVWTKRAVELLHEIKNVDTNNTKSLHALLQKGIEITDCNGAIFDVANNFAGCIPGIHEILKRQGLMQGIRTLDPKESLSPGQIGEIDRICLSYPYLNDDEFVKEHLDEWMK